jgi:hypothetical protein
VVYKRIIPILLCLTVACGADSTRLQCARAFGSTRHGLSAGEGAFARGRYQKIIAAAKASPKRIKRLVFANIDRQKMTWVQLNDLHLRIMRFSVFLWTAGIGAYGIGQLMRSYGIHNFYAEHNSNFTGGVGLILALDNALTSLAPHHRKKIAAMVYGAFGLANLIEETSWLMGTGAPDYLDLSSAGAAVIMAIAIQYVAEKSALLRTSEI